LTGAGAVVIQATQTGNGAYLAAPTVTKTIKVSRVAQKITFKLPASASLSTSPLALTGTASSKLSVTYAVVSGPAQIGSDGRSLLVNGVGTVVVEAKQSGDNVYSAATPIKSKIKIL
jgi:hypothetical protein